MTHSISHPLPFLPTEVVSKIMAELEIKELVACQTVRAHLSFSCDANFAFTELASADVSPPALDNLWFAAAAVPHLPCRVRHA